MLLTFHYRKAELVSVNTVKGMFNHPGRGSSWEIYCRKTDHTAVREIRGFTHSEILNGDSLPLIGVSPPITF